MKGKENEGRENKKETKLTKIITEEKETGGIRKDNRDEHKQTKRKTTEGNLREWKMSVMVHVFFCV